MKDARFPNASKGFLELNAHLLNPPPAPFNDKTAAEFCDQAQGCNQEAELQDLCEKELHRRGIPYIHLSPKAREAIGWPDLTFPRPCDGKACAVELKSKTGVATKEQLDTLLMFRGCNAVGEVVRTFDRFVQIVEGR
jgi:hypothetical protein